MTKYVKIICPWGNLLAKQEISKQVLCNLRTIWPTHTFIEVQ